MKRLTPTFRLPDRDESERILQLAQNPPLKIRCFSGSCISGDEIDEEQLTEDREAIETEIDRGNEMYTVNGKAFEYMEKPIELKVGQPVRIYLLSMTELDPVNNFHLHSDMFKYTPAGTIDSAPFVTDVVTLSQGDRGIIEFTPRNEGLMMFHSHVNEFTELGWMGNFEVVKS